MAIGWSASWPYGDRILKEFPRNDYFGELLSAKLLYLPTVTRQPFRNCGRITELLESGRLCGDFGIPQRDAVQDPVMLCGSPVFFGSLRAILEASE